MKDLTSLQALAPTRVRATFCNTLVGNLVGQPKGTPDLHDILTIFSARCTIAEFLSPLAISRAMATSRWFRSSLTDDTGTCHPQILFMWSYAGKKFAPAAICGKPTFDLYEPVSASWPIRADVFMIIHSWRMSPLPPSVRCCNNVHFLDFVH